MLVVLGGATLGHLKRSEVVNDYHEVQRRSVSRSAVLSAHGKTKLVDCLNESYSVSTLPVNFVIYITVIKKTKLHVDTY